MKLSIYLMMVLLALGTFACNKDDNPAENVIISLTEPTSGDSIASYNSVHCEGTITANGKMKGYSVYFIEESSGNVLYQSDYDTKADSYNIHEHWLNNVSTTTQVTIRIVVQKDEKGSTETKEVTVTCLQ